MTATSRTPLRAALVLVLCAFGAATLPAAASAGTYDVESCRDSAGGSLTSGAWESERLGLRRAGWEATDGCAAGDAMRGILRGNRSIRRGQGAQFIFRAPGNARLTRIVLEREIGATPGIGYQLYALVGDARRAIPLESCFGAGCAAISGRPLSRALPNGTGAVVARVSCRPSAGVCVRRADKLFAVLRVTRTLVTVEDLRDPVFNRRPQGPLTSPAPGQSGLKKLKIAASDAGGGLRSLTLVVDGAEVQSFPFSGRADTPCGTVFARRASCPNRSLRSFQFDTARLGNGAHELVLRLRDAAGNQTDSEPLLISTNNPGSPGTFTGLTAGLGTAGESTRLPKRTIGYGTAATLAGFVTDAAGVAIAGAVVRITPRIGGPGGAPQAVVETRTDATGRYGIPVPTGPSRSFEVRSVSGDAVTAATRADLEVALPVRLRTSREGPRVVRLRGSIPADPRPAEGVFVEIQAKSGKRFVPFRVVRTTPRGDFSLTYKFRGRGRFRLRAVVRPQGGLPFATGRSRVVGFTARR